MPPVKTGQINLNLDPHLWHPLGEAAYRGNGWSTPSPFIGRQSRGRGSKWQRSTMMLPIVVVQLVAGYDHLNDPRECPMACP